VLAGQLGERWDTERYDRSRPRYPDVMVERIVARQFEAAGCRVRGVEPDGRPRPPRGRAWRSRIGHQRPSRAAKAVSASASLALDDR
jgi:hypothetical protein